MPRFFLFFMLIYQVSTFAQNRQGSFLIDGKISSRTSELPTNTLLTDFSDIEIEAKAGYFLTQRQLLGVAFNFENRTQFDFNRFIQSSEKNTARTSEISTFYQYYFLPKSKIGFYAEAALRYRSLNKESGNLGFTKDGTFAMYLGAGAYYYLRKNVSIEFNFSLPVLFTNQIYSLRDRRINLAVLRTFAQRGEEKLPKLEDNYLFVRNAYYGIGWERNNEEGDFHNTRAFNFNAGFFLGSYWLLDITLSNRRNNFLQQRQRVFNHYAFENAFFIRLNSKGFYLRPSMTIELNNRRQVLANTLFFNSGQLLLDIKSNLEVMRFIKSRIIVGGGFSWRRSTYLQAQPRQLFSSVLRGTYFLNQDVAVECVAQIPFYDNTTILPEQENFRDYFISGLEFKIRTFFFQE